MLLPPPSFLLLPYYHHGNCYYYYSGDHDHDPVYWLLRPCGFFSSVLKPGWCARKTGKRKELDWILWLCCREHHDNQAKKRVRDRHKRKMRIFPNFFGLVDSDHDLADRRRPPHRSSHMCDVYGVGVVVWHTLWVRQIAGKKERRWLHPSSISFLFRSQTDSLMTSRKKSSWTTNVSRVNPFLVSNYVCGAFGKKWSDDMAIW